MNASKNLFISWIFFANNNVKWTSVTETEFLRHLVAENCVILRSLVLSQRQRATYGQTDTPPIDKSQSSIAERDSKNQSTLERVQALIALEYDAGSEQDVEREKRRAAHSVPKTNCSESMTVQLETVGRTLLTTRDGHAKVVVIRWNAPEFQK